MIFKNNIGWYAGAGSVRHDFYINGPINEPNEYEELLQILNTASENDSIFLHINSPGGCFYTACQICDAILQSKASAVIGCAEGEICSAATMIFLACNAWHVSPFSTFMFHTSSGGQYGKMPDTLKQINAHNEHLNRVCSYLYQPFFSEEEVGDIINKNQDIWLTPDQVTERLTEMSKLFEEEAEAVAADMEEQLTKAFDEQVEVRVKEELAKLSKKPKPKSKRKPKASDE